MAIGNPITSAPIAINWVRISMDGQERLIPATTSDAWNAMSLGLPSSLPYDRSQTAIKRIRRKLAALGLSGEFTVRQVKGNGQRITSAEESSIGPAGIAAIGAWRVPSSVAEFTQPRVA